MNGEEQIQERLERDEARLQRDEARLTYDEARLAAEDEAIHENAIVANTGIGLIVVLAIAIAALVLAVIAMRRDIDALDRPAPADSVSTAALQDGSVSATKLADSAVVRAVIADGAIGNLQMGIHAVSGANVGHDTLTGTNIRESSLGPVPSAQNADEAARLGGHPAGSYLSNASNATVQSLSNVQEVKGPVVARCPAGTRVVSGGAAIRGRTTGVSLVVSAPDGTTAWTATARARNDSRAWRLVVTAICAAGGS